MPATPSMSMDMYTRMSVTVRTRRRARLVRHDNRSEPPWCDQLITFDRGPHKLGTMTAGLVPSLVNALDSERELCHVPGLAVAVVRPDAAPQIQTFGTMDRAGTHAVTEHSVFPIASCTKAFTSAAIATLVDDGVLAWDTPVRDYLPDFRMADPVATAQLTLRDMLSHRTGLPRHDMLWYRNTTTDRGDIVAAFRHLQPNLPIRSRWQYNNLMYLAAAHVAERVTGQRFEVLVRDRLLTPLGMTTTYCSHADLPGTVEFGHGYAYRDEDLTSIAFSADDLVGPAGSILSCAADLTVWLQFHLNRGSHNDAQLISQVQMGQLHETVIAMPPPVLQTPEIITGGYGLGWGTIAYRGHRVIQHTGNVDGYSSSVCFAPTDGVAVAVLTNLDVTPLRDIAAYLVLDDVFGETTVPWGDRYRGLYEAAFGGMLGAADRRHLRAGDSTWTRPLDEYTGEYTHPAYGSVTVETEGATLTIGYRDIELEVRHLRYDSFELRNTLHQISIQCRFDADLEGRICAVAALLEPEVDPIVFDRVPASLPQEILSDMVGHYRRGPIDAVIVMDSDEPVLRMSLNGQPATPLVRREGLVFALESDANQTVEFVVDGPARPERIVVWPFGDFTRQPS